MRIARLTTHFMSGLLTAVFSTSTGYCDWEAKLTMTLHGAEQRVMNGHFRTKDTKVRTDMTGMGPMSASMILLPKEKKAYSLMAAQKSYMEISYNEASSKVPSCSSGDASKIENCLKESGFTKKGHETFQGHPCTIYEGSFTQKSDPASKARVQLWRPDDMKDVGSIRSLIYGKEGQLLAETVLSEIKFVAQADSYFQVPSDYKSMGNLNDMIQRFQKGDYSALKGMGGKMRPRAH